MSQELKCARCGKHMGTLRDAKIRTGMVVYCAICDKENQVKRASEPRSPDIPDFLKGLFK